MVTEAKRRANDRWDARNSFRFSVKMGVGEADALKEACAADGLTPHAFFLQAAREMIARHAEEAGSVQPTELPGDGAVKASGAGAETPNP